MAAPLQAKLLRVLQERELERIGDNRPIRIDVRIIAATNADLAQMVRDGAFREDLYYRLNVIPIFLPPLRERREDIPLLVRHFLEAPGRQPGRAREAAVTQAAMRRMMAYDWPVNIRQLENAMERALTLSRNRAWIDVADLPPELQQASLSETPPLPAIPEDGFDMAAYVAGIERQLIERALDDTGGNRQQAARRLGLKRTTLVEKLRRLGAGDAAPAASRGDG